MVLAANNALNLAESALDQQAMEKLNTEVSLAESAIRRAAASFGRTNLNYNATIVGNPAVDPFDDALVNPLQTGFRDTFSDAGYSVGRNPDNGYWILDWAAQGIEWQVQVYSVRTTVNPSGVSADTITAIQTFFGTQTIPARTRSVVQSNIDETSFGAAASAFFEYVVVVDQTDGTDLSASLRTYLAAQPDMGYTTGNMNVFRTVGPAD